MADFTTDEMVTFRRLWIRDYINGTEKLSDYNRANNVQYHNDSDINKIKAHVELDYEEELGVLQREAKANFIRLGNSEADSIAKAAQLRLDAVYSLCKAEVIKRQLIDPAYLMSLSEARERQLIYEQMQNQMIALRNFVMKRAGHFASIDIVYK